jgi:hypothetical protein
MALTYGERVDAQRGYVALLVATGQLTQTEIAKRVNISRKQLATWFNDPAFQSVSAGAGVQEARLADYNLIRESLRGVIEDRKAEAHEQLSMWKSWSEQLAVLQEAVEVCQEAVDTSDPEESEALRDAKADLMAAERRLRNHELYHKVEKPPLSALRGVLVREVKSVGKQAVETWKLDEALLRTLMAADKQAAEDLGQWLQKLKINVSELGDEQLMRLLAGGNLDDETTFG